MTQPQSRGCDPDDLICQMEVLRHLKGLESQMGNEAFLKKYPQLAEVKDQISHDVQTQEGVVQDAINSCAREETEGGGPPLPAPTEEPVESE